MALHPGWFLKLNLHDISMIYNSLGSWNVLQNPISEPNEVSTATVFRLEAMPEEHLAAGDVQCEFWACRLNPRVVIKSQTVVLLESVHVHPYPSISKSSEYLTTDIQHVFSASHLEAC